MLTLSAGAWVLLALGAVLVGMSKTAVPGANTITVAVYAAVLPAKASVGVLLVLLMVGDLFALWAYRAHADWATLRRLVPTVLLGVVVGTAFLAVAGDAVVRRVIGVILLLLLAVTVWRRARQNRASRQVAAGATGAAGAAEPPSAAPAGGSGAPAAAPAGGRGRSLESAGYGVLGGFTTMVANAGGPVMSMYFLASRFAMTTFLGTAAWFFFAVNLVKTPFSISLGLITGESLLLDAILAPGVVVGALVGRRLVRRMDQALFDRLVIALTFVSAAYLLV